MNAAISIGIFIGGNIAVKTYRIVALSICPRDAVARIQRCKCEACSLSFLGRQVFTCSQIQCRAEDWKRSVILPHLPRGLGISKRQQLLHKRWMLSQLAVSGHHPASIVKPRKWIRLPTPWNRCPQVTTGQPVLVKRVKRKFIDVHSPT